MFIFIDFVSEYHQKILDSLLNEENQESIYTYYEAIVNILVHQYQVVNLNL